MSELGIVAELMAAVILPAYFNIFDLERSSVCSETHLLCLRNRALQRLGRWGPYVHSCRTFIIFQRIGMPTSLWAGDSEHRNQGPKLLAFPNLTFNEKANIYTSSPYRHM